jgi:hypothetical protein
LLLWWLQLLLGVAIVAAWLLWLQVLSAPRLLGVCICFAVFPGLTAHLLLGWLACWLIRFVATPGQMLPRRPGIAYTCKNGTMTANANCA